MAKLNADVPPSAVAAAIAKSASYTAPGADGIPYEPRAPPRGGGILLNLRLHCHSLHSLTGAQCTPEVPLDQRTCAHCRADGSHKVEDEIHFVLHCPAQSDARAEMLSRLRDIYPRFDSQWLVSNDAQKVRILLWGIPDMTAPWRPRDGTLSDARVQATGAVLRFLGKAAKRHPTMRRLMFGRAPGA